MEKLTPSSAVRAALIVLGVGVAPLANAAYTFTDLGTPGETGSYADAINNVGQVAETAFTTGDVIEHAILRNDTSLIDLNSLLDGGTANTGWMLFRTDGIGDHGWIVGDATNSSTDQVHDHADAPAPIAAVPEPEIYAMLLVGLGLLGFAGRRNLRGRQAA